MLRKLSFYKTKYKNFFVLNYNFQKDMMTVIFFVMYMKILDVLVQLVKSVKIWLKWHVLWCLYGVCFCDIHGIRIYWMLFASVIDRIRELYIFCLFRYYISTICDKAFIYWLVFYFSLEYFWESLFRSSCVLVFFKLLFLHGGLQAVCTTEI